MKIEFISRNKDGNYYVGYRIPVKRGIRGKTKGIVDELIIIGMNKDKFKDFCIKNNLQIKENII